MLQWNPTCEVMVSRSSSHQLGQEPPPGARGVSPPQNTHKSSQGQGSQGEWWPEICPEHPEENTLLLDTLVPRIDDAAALKMRRHPRALVAAGQWVTLLGSSWLAVLALVPQVRALPALLCHQNPTCRGLSCWSRRALPWGSSAVLQNGGKEKLGGQLA